MNSYTLHRDELDGYRDEVQDMDDLDDVELLVEVLEHHERVLRSIRGDAGYRASSLSNPFDHAIGDALTVASAFGQDTEDRANDCLDTVQRLLNIAYRREDELRME
jgi:hypothetical protein